MTSTLVSHYSTVMDLTDRQISRIDRASHVSTVAKVILTPVAFMASGIAIYGLNKLTVRFTDLAIWFRGASRGALHDNFDFGNQGKELVERTEASKQQVLSIRKSLLSLTEVKRPQVRAAIDCAIAATADIFEALEEFKWAMYELEANHAPRIEGMTANSPEDVAELFKRISQEA